jgi:hypothetical protein
MTITILSGSGSITNTAFARCGHSVSGDRHVMLFQGAQVSGVYSQLNFSDCMFANTDGTGNGFTSG